LVINPASDPAFARAAATVASLYDRQAIHAAQGQDATVARWDGGQWLLSRDIDELRRRRRHIEAWANVHRGFMGRTPDMGASMLCGMVMGADTLRAHEQRGTESLVEFYHHASREDLFIAHAIIPPQWRTGMGAQAQRGLAIVEHRNDGIVLSGVRSLATGALLANEIFVSSIRPLAPDQHREAFAAMVPPNASGLRILARDSFELTANCRHDAPLSWQFDETDALLHFEAVFVPWERVFFHGKPELCRLQYFATPAHVLQNYQAQIRLLVKLRFMLTLAHRVADLNGVAQVSSVQEKLGKLGAELTMLEAGLTAMEVHGEQLGPWYVPSPRFLYAGMATSQPLYGRCVDLLRDLAGASGVGTPTAASFENEELRHIYQLISGGDLNAFQERARLFRLLQDIVGSAFGGRHEQYERFYAGSSQVVAQNAYQSFNWEEQAASLDALLSS
jgi:4-hydroxyphenylacetate 3-monooxygenase